MATSPNGSASAHKSDVMSGLEVRSPVPPARSTTDLVAQVLARVRANQSGAPAAKPAAPAAGAVAPRPPQTNAGSGAMQEIEVRKPPGPHAKAAPAPLKGPAAATPPRAPSPAAQAKSGAPGHGGPSAAAAPGGKPAAPQAATPPAAVAAAPAGPPSATSLIDDTASWLPPEPERKIAFLQVFRYWHAQVRPEYAHKARPALLFLVTALPVMVKARDTLEAANLWEPPGEHSRQARDVHPAWKKYCEFLPRATQALQELDDYRHLSLLTALDDLNARVIRAEKRFREGLTRPGR